MEGKWSPSRSCSPASEVTNRVIFGLITWFAGPGKSSREFVYKIYIYIYIYISCWRKEQQINNK